MWERGASAGPQACREGVAGRDGRCQAAWDEGRELGSLACMMSAPLPRCPHAPCAPRAAALACVTLSGTL